MTKRKIYKTVKNLDKNLSSREDAFKVACLMLKGLETQNVKTLSEFFKYPLLWVKKVAERLKLNGIWNHGKTYADWGNEETGGISFWVDVNVGLGYIERCT